MLLCQEYIIKCDDKYSMYLLLAMIKEMHIHTDNVRVLLAFLLYTIILPHE